MEFSGVRRFMAQPPLERKVMRLETRMANCGFCKLQDNCPGMNDCVHWSEDAQRYNWLRSRQKLDLRSDCTKWTRKDGTRFTASHYLAEGDMRHGPAETLDETIDAAMRVRADAHNARLTGPQREATTATRNKTMSENSQAVVAPVEPSVRPDAERAAFERWAEDNQFCTHRDDSDKYREYHRATTRWAWQAWQAARVDLVAALQWYANGMHFDKASPDAWDTVSGEPQNWWCDEAGTATVEDGSIAAMTLRGELTAAQIQALD